MRLIPLFLLFVIPVKAEVRDACLKTEHWSIPSARNAERPWIESFHRYTSGAMKTQQAFAEAIQLKRIASILKHPEMEEDFSTYWVARVLFDLGILPLAQQAFLSSLETTPYPDLKKASYSCLARIQAMSPDLKAPDPSVVPAQLWTEADSDTLVPVLMGNDHFTVSKLSPGHREWIKGIRSIRSKNYSDAISSLQNFFQFLDAHPVSSLHHFRDEAHLLLGRALFSVARFQDAAKEFQSVKKSSNHEIEALGNLAWTYLLQEKYDEALGISMQLRSGALKSTFAPEPMMVSAMALNELCLYPESIRMVQTLVKEYTSAHEWLNAHPKSPNGYAITLQALKLKSDAPSKLNTEWIRRPEFLARQIEINELFQHPRILQKFGHDGYVEQIHMTREFNQKAAEFIRDHRASPKRGDLKTRFAELRKSLRTIKKFHQASRSWKTLERGYGARIPKLRNLLVEKVNANFNQQNQTLLTLLKHVRTNVDLIEVEIYNGASQDLIWKEAHPEFEQKMEQFNLAKPGLKHPEVWSWGRFPASDLENTEIWEDELGTLKADIQSQCGAKERFLKLKLSQRRHS
jgi:TolA-binding protein